MLSAQQQVQVTVRGIAVDFPYTPYAAQVEYMEAVIRTLEGTSSSKNGGGCNALLESPTGTGKTLCLLCATLAWIANEKAQRPASRGVMGMMQPTMHRVVYTSRTHAQLAQVVREYRKTTYSKAFRMAVLGSREHMCVNPQVLRLPSSSAQNSACSMLRSEKSCRFYNGVQRLVGDGGRMRAPSSSLSAIEGPTEVHDIEELAAAGRRDGFCPYFFERVRVKDCDVVFLPYSYILDPSLHAQLPFPLDGCILIVDEAHNVPSFLSSSSAQNLTPVTLATAINDASRAITALRHEAQAGNERDVAREEQRMEQEQDFAALKIVLCKLETAIAEEPMGTAAAASASKCGAATVAPKGPLDGKELVRPGTFMHTFLARAHITAAMVHGEDAALRKTVSNAVTVLAATDSGAQGLNGVQQFLDHVFGIGLTHAEVDEACRFVLVTDDGSQRRGRNEQQGQSRTLGFWCLDTSVVLRQATTGVRNILMTSGTLSPLEHFAAELGLSFEVLLQGTHVIGLDQVLASILPRGPGGQQLNGSYALRNSVDYRHGLGMTMLNLARVVPGGMLVFFPSYVAMNGALDAWKLGTGGVTTVWGMLSEVKALFIEPTDATELQPVVQSFQKAADEPRGAMLFAVCRGKISEGVDFADRHGRCVVVTGIPFANSTDLLVRLKREYFTNVAPQRPKVKGKLFTGEDWYRNEALRSVNQCVGRVIRHKDDYGAVVLADERFGNMQDALSHWISRVVAVHREFRDAYGAIVRFFKQRRTTSTATATSTASAMSFGDRCADGAATMEVRVNTSIPSTAEAASAFAAQQEQQHNAEREKEALRNLLAANDAHAQLSPVTPLLLLGTTTAAPPVATPSPVIMMRKQVIAQDTLPAAGAAGSSSSGGAGVAAAGTPSSSSKEYCQRLKARLSDPAYAAFKDVLGSIARLGSMKDLAPTEVKERFAAQVDNLRAAFEALEDRDALMREFGCYIPEAYRMYYASLLKKRTRPL